MNNTSTSSHDNGCDISHYSSKIKKLYSAVCFNKIRKMEKYIEEWTSPINFFREPLDDDGSTALHVAVECYVNCDDMIHLLIDKGNVNINQQNNHSKTPLCIACANDNDHAVSVLLQCPYCDISLCDELGWTPLMWAVSNQNDNTVQRLLMFIFMHNRNDNSIDSQGKTSRNTALHIAAKAGYLKGIELLLDHGCDKHIKNADDSTAEQLAMSNEHYEAVMLIRNYEESIIVDI